MSLKNSSRNSNRRTSSTVQKLNEEMTKLKVELTQIQEDKLNLNQRLDGKIVENKKILDACNAKNDELLSLQKKINLLENDSLKLKQDMLVKNKAHEEALILLHDNKDKINYLNKLKDKYSTLENSYKDLDQKILSIYELFEKVVEDNVRLVNEKNSINQKIQVAELDKTFYQNKISDIKHQLSYTLGSAIVSTKADIRDVINFPKKIIGSYKKYYDYKLLKSNEVTNYNKLTIITENEYNLITPLRFGEKSNILKTDFFLNFQKISFKSKSLKPNSINDIQFTLQVLKGSLSFTNLIDNKEIKLKTNDSHTFIFKIQDTCELSLLEILKYSNEIEVLIKMSKKTGKPVILELINDNTLSLSQIDQPKNKEFKYQLPNAPKNDVLLKATLIAEKFGNEAAFDYYEKYSKEKNRSLLHILKSNLYHDNVDIWLNEINQYFESRSVDKIMLGNKEDKYRYLQIKEQENIKCVSEFKISVIMPAYNAEQTIYKSVMSILNQTWENLELIVVNDCSSDNTLNILNDIEDERLKVISNNVNVGAYVSKNIALSYASGKYVTGHDADDWALPRRLENHVNEIVKTNYPRASLTKMIRMDINGFFSHIGREGLFCEDGALRIASITCMFEREFLVRELGAWDSVRMGADSEIISRAKIKLGEEFKTFDLISMICLDAEGSLTNDPIHGVSKETGLSDTRKIYKKSWQNWHQSLNVNKDSIKLDFPLSARPYYAPDVMAVSAEIATAAFSEN